MSEKMREVPPITDETYKALMVALGMPNNRSLLSALQQIANHATQRAAWQAAQSVPADEDSVISIASAYESGIGHCNDNLCNPYKVGSAESFAYDYGKEFGKARGIEQYVPVVGEAVAWFYEDPFSGNYLTSEQISCNDIPLYFAPATCITQAELERLRKDAERYAVVRDSTYCDVYMHEIYLTDDDLDAAIDAAIAAGEGE